MLYDAIEEMFITCKAYIFFIPILNINKSTMKSILCTLLFCFTSLFCFSQERDYLAEMFAAHHGISQKEGTTEALKKLLGPYGENRKEVYAILFAPQACPRCEVDVIYALNHIKSIKPEATVVVIAAYPDADKAIEYVKDKFKTNQVIVDTKNKHEQIFHYRTGRLAVTYLLQIDTQQGRLMCGGDSPNMSMDFLQQFCNNTAYMPYAETADTKGINNPVNPTTHPIQQKATGTYRSVNIKTSDNFSISSVLELPEWQGKSFIYSDELLSKAILFDIQEDTAYMKKQICPTETQEMAFSKIPPSEFRKMKKEGLLFIMANCAAFIPGTEQAIVSYSLPDLSLESDSSIAYYNKPVVLETLGHGDSCRMSSFEFEHDSIPLYMYTHASRIIPLDKKYVLIGCRKGFPTTCTAKDCRKDPNADIFQSSFYDHSPFCALFDITTGRRVARFGQLDDVFKTSRTGYYFTIPIADGYKDKVAFSDGCSGKLWIADRGAEAQAKEVKLFDVPVPESILATTTSLQYTDEYFDPFFTVFHQYIDMIKTDKRGIHCLIRNGESAIKGKDDIYEYHLLTYEGKIQESFQLQFEEKDELLSVGLGKDEQNAVFPYYLCRNAGNCYLKYIVR